MRPRRRLVPPALVLALLLGAVPLVPGALAAAGAGSHDAAEVPAHGAAQGKAKAPARTPAKGHDEGKDAHGHAAGAEKPATPAAAPAGPLTRVRNAVKAMISPPSADAAAATATPAGPPPDEDPVLLWKGLADGNRRFMRGAPAVREVIRRRVDLAGGQKPRVIVLGCADSRVPPELLFDRNIGDLFVVRTAGNVVDPVVLGSIEYAVEHLGAHLIVVLGHEKCGAVKAAASGEMPESPNLQAVIAKIQPTLEKLREVVDGPALASLGVEVNVHRAAKALVEESEVLRHAVESGEVGVVKAVYRLESGEVVKLD